MNYVQIPSRCEDGKFQALRPLFDQVAISSADIMTVDEDQLRHPEFVGSTTFARIPLSTCIAAAAKVQGHPHVHSDWSKDTSDGRQWRGRDLWVLEEAGGWIAFRRERDGEEWMEEFLCCRPDKAILLFPDAESAMLFVQAVSESSSDDFAPLDWR